MLVQYSPQARYVKSARDLSHIELARSDNISSSSGWGSPKQRMSFGGSQRSENISSGRSSHIDRKKNKSKNRRKAYPFTLALFAAKSITQVFAYSEDTYARRLRTSSTRPRGICELDSVATQRNSSSNRIAAPEKPKAPT